MSVLMRFYFLTGESLDREISLVFDDELLGAARKLKKLKIAGWGDTQVKKFTGWPKKNNALDPGCLSCKSSFSFIFNYAPSKLKLYFHYVKLKLHTKRKKMSNNFLKTPPFLIHPVNSYMHMLSIHRFKYPERLHSRI